MGGGGETLKEPLCASSCDPSCGLTIRMIQCRRKQFCAGPSRVNRGSSEEP